MKFRLFFLFLFVFLSAFKLNAQELNIFDLMFYERNENKNIGFVSLSGIRPNGAGWFVIPNLTKKEEREIQNSGCIKLETKFRKYFFSNEKIPETAKVFIYDYSKDVLKTFKVKDLNFIACLSAYVDREKRPYDINDFMIGFEINKKFLPDFDMYFTNALVFIGKENPFIQGQLKRIVWQKNKPKYFPSNKVETKDVYFTESEYSKGDTYQYETDELQYFLQELVKNNDVRAKRLLVMNSRTNSKVYEEVYSLGEGDSFASLDGQRTGKLFKNKPKVIFGFKHRSFGCESIEFLKSSEKGIQIDCDNRH
ncbi:hypothetical protein [Leptospira santarosai]|uniref:hypothetical protein n=1 Tax=Leptospira santarosai TaxID=28183 RepID=UPI0003183150|nr:hypothetical protein [Leptospira santarosai]MDI7190104.1 hypothetical protein [Leptospira santarosai]MDI7215245.1 hypothetical protein [Leptospira santarosai]MDI7234555.1 hypothetical protein [Leptospira santarosai]